MALLDKVQTLICIISCLHDFSHTGDFALSSSVFYFNASSFVGQVSCVQFRVLNDSLVGEDETFTFRAVPRNPLDTFTNGSTISITIFDDDGA